MPDEEAVDETVVHPTDDVIFVRPVGVLSLAQAQAITSLADALLAERGHYFLKVDLENAGLLTVETRRHLARFGAAKPPLAVALYHVSPLLRGMNALLFGAMNLFSQQRQNVGQFATEAAAVTWLEAERERLLFAPSRR